MKKLSDDLYEVDDGSLVALAPGSYDPQDSASIEAAINAALDAILNPPPPTPAQIRAQKRLDIDALRVQKIAAGLSYVFPDGQAGTIQIRHIVDQANLTGLGTAALARKGKGRTDVFAFIDAENIRHTLTPDEMIDLGLAVQEFVSALTETARAKKDELAAATDPAAYDIESGW